MSPRQSGLLLLALALGACDDPDLPEDPVWDKQPCDHCRMLVSEPRHAGQAVGGDGTRRYFDDVGCLALHAGEHGAAVKHAWVRSDGRWVDARRARYESGHKTPMGFGFVPAKGGDRDFAAVVAEVQRKRAAGGAR